MTNVTLVIGHDTALFLVEELNLVFGTITTEDPALFRQCQCALCCLDEQGISFWFQAVAQVFVWSNVSRWAHSEGCRM